MANDRADQLFAAIIQANVNDLAHTNAIIQAGLEQDVEEVAQAFLALYDAVDREPMVSRKLLVMLDRMAGMVHFAEGILTTRKEYRENGWLVDNSG